MCEGLEIGKINIDKQVMTKKEVVKLFEERKVRAIWDDKEEKWYFSIVDVVAVLTDSKNAAAYWRKLKQRLKAEGNETVTNCHGLKLRAADGKMRTTDVADTEQLFRLVQSIPSPKAEPFKQWMAQVASSRMDQMQDPELSIDQAVADYRRLGYSDAWINQRLKSIEIRKELTDEWKRTGVREGLEFASLTDIITREWSGFTTKQYKTFKGLKKESLRDNMTNLEMAFNILAEASATELSKKRDPNGYKEQKGVARDGGSVAKAARHQLESKLGHSVVSPAKARDYLPPTEPPIEDSESTEDEKKE
ncbi:BRO family, N-terminal domain [Prevotella sp. KH2C16]|nr:BRO family, N-terminal domain [Prevotella sp. KH2C16]